MRSYRVALDPAAVEDLAAIRAFVADAAGESVAERLIDRVLSHIDGFATAPKRGRARDDLRIGLRTIGWRRTVTLIFAVDDDAGTVVFLGVLFRGRNVEAALQARL